MRATWHAVGALAFLFVPAVLIGQEAALPEGVTAELIAEGESIFKGAGICTACHGPKGGGLKGMGADLTDDEWLHGSGSYDDIVAQVLEGVPASKSSNGLMMPPKGGSQISEAQVKAVAAYVWSLSNGPAEQSAGPREPGHGQRHHRRRHHPS